MDKEKLKKYAGYAGYAGLGFVGGFVGGFLGILIMDMEPPGLIHGVLVSGLGGWLAGVSANKWWGALVGGFVLFWLIVLIPQWLLDLLGFLIDVAFGW